MFRDLHRRAWAPVAVHVLLCLVHLFLLTRSPLLHYLTVDLETYDLWARDIASGHWLGTRVYYQDPLYPYLMALIYRLGGADILHVLLVQIAASAGTVVLVRRLGSQLWCERVGVLGAWMAALYQPAIYYACKPEKACFSAFGLTLALWWTLLALRQPSAARWVRCGVLFGLVGLLRANVLLLIALGVPLLAWKHWRSALWLVAGSGLVLLPVLFRNHAVGGDWVLTTSQGGANLYIGNNPENTSGSYMAPSFVRPSPRFEQEDFHRHAESVLGRPLLPSEGSGYYLGEVLGWALRDPASFMKLQLRKAYAFVNAYEIPDNWSVYFVRHYSWVLGLPLLRYGWILPFAILGALELALLSRGDAGRAVFALSVVVYSGSVIAFFIFSRYRYPITPAFQVLAAAALVQGLDWWRADRVRLLSVAAAGCLALEILVVSPPTVDAQGDLSHRHFNLAASYFLDGRLDEAQRLCESALAVSPQNHLALFTISRIASLRGDETKALDYLMRAHRAGPDDEDVLVQMAWANARQGGYVSAARFATEWLGTHESYQLRRALVEIALQNRESEAARFQLAELLRRYPGDAWGKEKQGSLDAGHGAEGGMPEAQAVLAEVEALARQKRYPEAIERLQGEISAGRATAATFQYLSNLYYLGGELLRARDALGRALEMEPGNPLYKSNLRALDEALRRRGS